MVRRPWQRLTGKSSAVNAASGDRTGNEPGPGDSQPAGGPDGSGSLLRELTRYAEARALVGGCTAIQGASGKYPDNHESLVRNVDLRLFGQHRARSMIDLGRTDEQDRARLRQRIDAGEVLALYVHLAEGVDERSRAEFDELIAAGLLTPATVIIHGTALTAQQWGQVPMPAPSWCGRRSRI